MNQRTDPQPPTRSDSLVWDTNTLRRGLQRHVFSSLVETTGGNVYLVEQTARELARLVDPRAPAAGLRTLYSGYEDPTPIEHQLIYRSDPRTTIAFQIWWAEEFARPEGLYRPIILDEEGERRYDKLMDSFCTSRTFPDLTEDDVRTHADAITICQAAAVDGKIIVTPDEDYAERPEHYRPNKDYLAANKWAVEQYRAGNLKQPMIVVRPERELEDWSSEQPEQMLKAVIACAWPSDPQAPQTTIEERFKHIIDQMQKVLYLAPTATFCHNEYSAHPEPARLVEEVRYSLPERTRAADARHPANPENRRNWATPDNSVRQIAELPLWRLLVTKTTFRIDRHQNGVTYTKTAEIPIHERQRIINTLIEHGIEVRGTPHHNGSKNDSGRFSTAMNILIDEELAKTIEHTR